VGSRFLDDVSRQFAGIRFGRSRRSASIGGHRAKIRADSNDFGPRLDVD
jgi:hypothetical protein